MIVAGVVFWVVLLSGLTLWWTLAARRRRRHPPEKTPQQVWDESDPEYRTWNASGGPIGPMP